MPRRTNSAGLVLCVWLTLGGSALTEGPNLIHILADDLGWTDLSSGLTSLGNGSAFYQTPNIDRLASEGLAFTSAYAVQTCVPTRISIMTGQYATRTRSYDVGSIEGDSGDLLVGAANNNTLDTAATTLGETLQGAGYTTAHFGKFHTTETISQIVTDHGFDFDYGGGTTGAPRGFFASANNTFDAAVGVGLDPYAVPYTQAYIDANLKPFANGADVDSLVGTAKHLTDATADAAIDFIGDRIAANDGPFYMNLAFHAVHTPIEPRPDLQAKYDSVLTSNAGVSPDPRHDDAGYAGLLEGMDQSIGRLVAYLADPDGDGDPSDSIAENTVLMFYGDNGGARQATDNSPLSGAKGSQSEGGLRVPLIAWSPGRITNGVSHEPVHAVDFYPTFAEFAGAATPDPAVQQLDGESLAGLLTGQTLQTDRDAVFFHYPGNNGQNRPVSTVVLDAGENRRKLMYFYERREFEVYALDTDLGETNDLAEGEMTPGEYKLAARATGELRAWLDETGAEYPTVRDTGETVPAPNHLPRIVFDTGSDFDGLATGSVDQLGVELTLSAVGQAATLDADTTGVGVASALDTGGATQRRRVNGSLATPEAIELSFDTDVMLKSLSLGAINTNGNEAIVLGFVSGDNPFAGLAGYDTNGYTLGGDYLTFDATQAQGTDHLLEFGILGQEELFLTAGTVLSLTADPAVGGGLLLSAVAIAEPLSAIERVLLDYDLNGTIDAADYTVWRSTYGSTSDLRADGNGDGVVDTADYAVWRDALEASVVTSSQAVPEPNAMTVCFVALLARAASAPRRGKLSHDS